MPEENGSRLISCTYDFVSRQSEFAEFADQEFYIDPEGKPHFFDYSFKPSEALQASFGRACIAHINQQFPDPAEDTRAGMAKEGALHCFQKFAELAPAA